MGLTYKFGTLVDNEDVPFAYSNLWERERTSGPERLVIAPERDHLALLIRLAQLWSGDFGLLYVLLESRLGNREGRYQAPNVLGEFQLRAFAKRFGSFLEHDGRHHLWIASAIAPANTLVYDQHNLIYAYGDLDHYAEVLQQSGYRQGTVRFPAPHTHHYHATYDADEAALLQYWAWKRSPLQPEDRP
jgi:hypothetical protein